MTPISTLFRIRVCPQMEYAMRRNNCYLSSLEKKCTYRDPYLFWNINRFQFSYAFAVSTHLMFVLHSLTDRLCLRAQFLFVVIFEYWDDWFTPSNVSVCTRIAATYSRQSYLFGSGVDDLRLNDSARHMMCFDVMNSYNVSYNKLIRMATATRNA